MMPCSNEIVHLISFILEICKGTCACCTVLFFLFIKEILIKSSWFLSLTRLPCYRIQPYMPAGLQSTVQTCVRQQRAIEAKWNVFPLHQPADTRTSGGKGSVLQTDPQVFGCPHVMFLFLLHLACGHNCRGLSGLEILTISIPFVLSSIFRSLKLIEQLTDNKCWTLDFIFQLNIFNEMLGRIKVMAKFQNWPNQKGMHSILKGHVRTLK